jgi:class 3 adenylate cyclase
VSVDLSGFAALAARPDPERLRGVLRACQDAVAGTVARLGGYVAEPVDDRVLAYFGWSRAHEDDAARCQFRSIPDRRRASAGVDVALPVRRGAAPAAPEACHGPPSCRARRPRGARRHEASRLAGGSHMADVFHT